MYLKIGKIVGTHGIKGEIRILSDFEKKNLVFKPGFKLYFYDTYQEHIIKTYRHHKEFEMITFDEYSNINDVLKYKGADVYINKFDLNLEDNEVIINELVGYEVYYLGEYCGNIIDFVYNNINNLLIIKNVEQYYVPYHENFIENVDKVNKKIYLKNIEGLM